jgi:hypothetical protein
MRLILGLLVVLAGCNALDRPEVKDCENYLKGKLRSPSTYKRISTYSYAANGKQHVSIEHDAANAYGTPIRATQFCFYPIKNGKPDTSQYIDHDAALANQFSDEELMGLNTEVSLEALDNVGNE